MASTAPALSPKVTDVVSGQNKTKNKTASAIRVSEKSAVPTTIAPEFAASAEADRLRPPDKGSAPAGVPGQSLPRLRFEMAGLKEKPAQAPKRRLPTPQSKTTAAGHLTYLGEIVFRPGKVTLSKKAEAQIKEMAARILAAPPATALVEGHADRSRLSASTRRKYGDNYGLSLARASAVARALAAAGVDPGRVYLIAYGAAPASGSPGSGRMVRVGLGPVWPKK